MGLNHQDGGDLDLAREAYQEALRLDARSVPALNNLAILKRAEGDVASSVELFEQALEIDPEHRGARMGLAGALLADERPQAALDHYLELRKETPDDVRVYRGLALCHLNLGQLKKALLWCEEAEKGGDPYDALLLRAFVLEHNATGDRYGLGYDETAARGTYQGIVSRFPDQPLAYYNWGIIHAKAGRWLDAVTQFDRALSADSTYVDALTALAEVERVMKSQNTKLLRIKRP